MPSTSSLRLPLLATSICVALATAHADNLKKKTVSSKVITTRAKPVTVKKTGSIQSEKVKLKPGVITGPVVTRPYKKVAIGQRFLVTGSWYVTNADDGISGPFSSDLKVEIKGETRFDGKEVHSRTLADPSVVKTAGNNFKNSPYIVDYYYDRPGTKMLRVSGEYVDHDKGSGNDLMWRHDEQLDLDQIVRDGKGSTGSVKSGETILSGDNDSESLDIRIKVVAGEFLYK
ncbi:hypothetical protein EON80_06715 [bacterium]|nr:MAG: hypothetical protein EON80_06715 [bacterium]